MILFLRVGFLSNRIQKMALRAWLPRRCLSHRSYLFAFALLCLMGLTLVAFFGAILGRHRSSLVEYVVVGTDSHKSVLRLNWSQVSIRRIELLSPTCIIDCGIPQVDSGIRPIIGVFLVQETTESFQSAGEIHSDGVIEDPPEIHESVHDAVKGPMEIHEPIHEDEAGVETVETFINCDPSFDYAVYVVLRSVGPQSSEMPSEDGIVQVATPWMDHLLRRTTEECRRQSVNITVWLTTISSELNVVNALNDVLIEAYFDNVTWYDLLVWSDPAQSSHVMPLKWAEQPTEVLQRTKNVGVVTSAGRRLFLHRRHYEIFGHFFPLTDWTLDTAVRYLLRLYSPQWSSHQRTGLVDHTATEGIDKNSRVGSKADVVIGNGDGRDFSVGGNSSDGVSDRKGENDYLAEMMAIDSHLLQRYVKALDATDFDQRRDSLRHSGRMIAMSLYGDDPKYTLGAVRNAQLLPVIFPGWRLFIYCQRQVPSETVGGPASCVSVPPQVTRKLEELGAELKYIDPGVLAPMMWRFLPVDDATVDVFISRDSDSRLTERDAAIVSAWLDTDTLFHCIRDHPSHAKYSISGGLWGARTKWLRLVLGEQSIASRVQYSNSYLEDMRFLGSELWPLVQSSAHCHDSVSCDTWPNSHPIPIQRQKAEHVGQVFDAHSIPRQIDIDLLTAAERNSKCEPDRVS